jgi:hypothetical protein
MNSLKGTQAMVGMLAASAYASSAGLHGPISRNHRTRAGSTFMESPKAKYQKRKRRSR